MNVNVFAGTGKNRELVGTVPIQVGMVTNLGKVEKVTNSTVVFQDGSRLRNLERVYVSHSQAVKFGYPNIDGSVRLKEREITRRGQTILA